MSLREDIEGIEHRIWEMLNLLTSKDYSDAEKIETVTKALLDLRKDL